MYSPASHSACVPQPPYQLLVLNIDDWDYGNSPIKRKFSTTFSARNRAVDNESDEVMSTY